MRKRRKTASILLTALLVALLAVGVLAVEGEGSITINNAKEGQTYSLYRIFDLTHNDKTGDDLAVNYKVAEGWTEFFAAEAPGEKFVEIDKAGNVSLKPLEDKSDEEWAKEFAAAALAWAKEKPIKPTASQKVDAPTGSSAPSEEGKELVFSDLPLGYYLVDSTVGTLLTLDSTVPDVAFTDKNDLPTLKKEVDETDGFAGVGDVLTYTVTIDAKAGAQNYTFHDTMTAGLTFNETSVQVQKQTGTGAAETIEQEGNYELRTATTGMTDGYTFEIVFTEDFCGKLTDADLILITYTATVNKEAVSLDPLTNTAKLTYGEEGGVETDPKDTDPDDPEPGKTDTYPLSLEVFKYTEKDKTEGEGKEEVALAGAEFVLYRQKEGSDPTAYEYALVDTELKVLEGWTDEKEEATHLISEAAKEEAGAAGPAPHIVVNGLDNGTYYLEEVKAPNGYNQLEEPLEVELTGEKPTVSAGGHATSKVTVDGGEPQLNNVVKVLNNAGTRLPSTGGMGTTIFYVVGGLLVLCAAVVLVARRRSAR